MHSISRRAGIGLLVYGIGVTATFLFIGAPGGDYEESGITAYIDSGHWPLAFLLAYVGAFAALALLVVGHELRSLGGLLGETMWGLAVVGTAVGAVGAFVTGGLDVAMAEGGQAVQTGVPHPVIYTVAEIGNLLAVCGPALFVGVMALGLAATAPLPVWLKVVTGVAGVCGILAPFFFTYFLFTLWTLGFGARAALAHGSAPQPQLA